MMKAQKTQCIKHIFEFYISNGKRVATYLNKAIFEYPIQLSKCKVICMLSMKILQFV